MKSRPGRCKDITGQRFGKLVAIKRMGISENGLTTWLFSCDCGEEKEIEMTRVLHRNKKDCGCLKIGRINNNGNYEPSNAAWKNLTEQARNRRNTIWYDIEGVSKPLIEWCQILNVKYTTAFERHRRTGVYFLQQELQPYLGRS